MMREHRPLRGLHMLAALLLALFIATSDIAQVPADPIDADVEALLVGDLSTADELVALDRNSAAGMAG